MPDRIPPDELTDLEHRLAALRPSSGGLDRDRMLFEAGRASARAERRARGWMFAAAASALMAVGLGVGLARERSRVLDLERALIVAREVRSAPREAAVPASPAPPFEVAADSYLALSRGAFAGLDDPRPAPSRPPDRLQPSLPDRPLSPLRSRSTDGLRDL